MQIRAGSARFVIADKIALLASVLQPLAAGFGLLGVVWCWRRGRRFEALRELSTLLVSIHVRCDPRCCARFLSVLLSLRVLFETLGHRSDDGVTYGALFGHALPGCPLGCVVRTALGVAAARAPCRVARGA